MNKETYKALKEVIEFTKGKSKKLKNNDIVAVENWIDKVAKKYKEYSNVWKCPTCGL